MKLSIIAISTGLLIASAAAVAQTTPPTSPPSAVPAPAVKQPQAATPQSMPDAQKVTLTDQQAKGWVDKKVYSSDDKKLGEIAAFARDPAGNITELHADVGGFLGLGETRVRVMPAQFRFMGDHVMLLLTAEQAKALPKIAK
jgi:PRC-barrel domain